MKYLYAMSIILFAAIANAQELNKKLNDQIVDKEILLNECSRDGLVSFPDFKGSYDIFYDNYQVDSTQLDRLKKLMENKKVKVVLGTWCGDSKMQIPHFLKVADALKTDSNSITFIAVDGNKQAEKGLLNGLNIERVPTFIVTDNEGKEIGRIIESPRKSIELDLIEILTTKE